MAKSKQSLMKSIFSGEILEYLVFPFPAMISEEQDMVKIITDSMAQWAEESFDAELADKECRYPDGAFEALAELGFFGLNVPEEYGGLGLSQTAYLKVFEFVAGIDGSLPVTLGGHSSIGVKGLLLYGTPEQKAKYLPDLAGGKKIAAFALTEPGSGSDAASIQTRAVPQSDGSWLLNGQKLWITNGGYAQFFTVFAKTPVQRDGRSEDKITAFIVDGDLPGFTRGPEEHKLGIKATSTVPLFFDNVRLEHNSTLGELGKGFKVAMEVLNTGRLGLAAGMVGGSKAVLREALKHANERQQFGKPIGQFEMIQEKLARMTMKIFVAESITYLTGQLADKGDLDYSLESAISKVYASEAGWSVVNEGLQIMGGLGYMQGYLFERVLRDSRINMIFEGTNEILRLFIALSGMQAPAEYLRELGHALKEPIKGFGLLTDYAFTRVKEFVTTDQLQQVHPDLKKLAQRFGTTVEKFHQAADSAIMKFGKGVVEREMMLRRIADSAIHLYGMYAVLARVSRSLEEGGSETARTEVDIAVMYCEEAWRMIRRNLRTIRSHQDPQARRVAATMLDQERYGFSIYE